MMKEIKKCLFLIDVQYGFISGKTEYVLPRINNLMNRKDFDFIIASKFINTKNGPYVKYMNWHRLMDEKETKLYEPIEEKADLIIEKNIYTGIGNEVLKFIKNNNIDKIYLAGIDTDCCVLKTAVDFFEFGIRSYVLEYYSASNGGLESHQAALTVLRRLIGEDSIIRGQLK
ncbi:MAG: isochorismatase family protein [Clostridiales bacterium]